MKIKLAKMRSMAPHELPKVRLCAHLIHAIANEKSEEEINQSLKDLRAGIGSNWSIPTAFQYMSGQQAEMAIDCGNSEEKAYLIEAKMLADILSEIGLFRVRPADWKSISSLNLGK